MGWAICIISCRQWRVIWPWVRRLGREESIWMYRDSILYGSETRIMSCLILSLGRRSWVLIWRLPPLRAMGFRMIYGVSSRRLPTRHLRLGDWLRRRFQRRLLKGPISWWRIRGCQWVRRKRRLGGWKRLLGTRSLTRWRRRAVRKRDVNLCIVCLDILKRGLMSSSMVRGVWRSRKLGIVYGQQFLR